MEVPFCHTLIHALTPAEKRQFVIYAGRHVIGAQNNYLQLYHILADMPIYSEQELLQRMRAEGLPVKWFKADLNYVYHTLIDHLRHMHREASAHQQVLAWIAAAEMLLHKGMADACRKLLHKAELLARSIEAWDILWQVLYWQRRLAVAHPESGLVQQDITQQMLSASEALTAFTHILSLYESAVKLRQSGVAERDTASRKAFRKLLQHAIFRRKDSALSVLGAIRLHQVRGMYAYIQRDLQAELEEYKHIIRLYDTHTPLRNAYVLDYVAMHARIISIVKNSDKKTFQAALKAFRAFNPEEGALHSAAARAQIFAQSYMVELSGLIGEGNFFAGMQLLPEIRKGMQDNRNWLSAPVLMSFAFMEAYVLFAHGDYKAARSVMNKLLADFDASVRKDLFHFSRILDIMIHYKLANYSNIQSLHGSVAYYFSKQRGLYSIERRVLRFFAQPKQYKGHARYASLHILQADLEKLSKQNLERFALGYIDFMRWIKAEQNGVPMARVGD